jgi:hypothetical protein
MERNRRLRGHAWTEENRGSLRAVPDATQPAGCGADDPHPEARPGSLDMPVRKASRMGEGGTMRRAVTILGQLKKDEDGLALTMYTALIAILVVVAILAVREVGSLISESVAIISNF